jgi:hypothetical protein
MSQIGLFYGSTTGKTEEAAFGGDDVVTLYEIIEV